MNTPEPNPKAASELMVPSKEAMAAATEIFQDNVLQGLIESDRVERFESIATRCDATIIDRHFQPLRTQLSQAEKTAAELALVTEKLMDAIKPFARLGVARIETLEALSGYNVAFYDCPDDYVIYQDGMNPAISVGDIRDAAKQFRESKVALARYAASKQEAK